MAQKRILSDQHIFYVLGSILLFLFILYLGRPLLVPLAFALLLSFMLYPICSWMEGKGIRRLWSIIWTISTIVFGITAIIFLFSSHLMNIIEQFGGFTNKMNELAIESTKAINTIPFVEMSSYELMEKGKDWVETSGDDIVTNTLSVTTSFISGFVITIISAFLILLYRTGFKLALLKFARPENQGRYNEMFKKMQCVGTQYVSGMLLLIVILGTLNTIGLLVLGIKYALFFGFLAGILAIIPYIGTTIGSAIPALYAFLNCDSLWYPLGVILIFVTIQFIEGNFLTPKIIGGNLKLNALIVIVSLILGGLIWGVAGMILFLPYAAIFREFCKGYPSLQPITLIMGDKLYEPA